MNFESVEQLNHFLNKRLEIIYRPIDLSPYPLVLCHLDSCRRNVMVTPDNSIYLLDWAYAGLCPRFSEVATFAYFNDRDNTYRAGLIKAVEDAMDLTDEEKRRTDLIRRAAAGSLRYLL